jgi:hypothetical protein
LSNILLRLGIKPTVLNYFLPYLENLTENFAVFPYQHGNNGRPLEVFEKRAHIIPGGQVSWRAHPSFSPAVRHHFLFYSALESLCFFTLHPRWLHCPASIAISAVGLSPEPRYVSRLVTAFPNAQLHFAFGNDLPGTIMDCQIPLWLNQRYWHYDYRQDRVYVNNGLQIFSIMAENFSCASLLGHATGRRFKKERPRGGHASFFEQLKYP